MTDEIKQETPAEPKMRQIIIETNGDDIRIVKSEVAGKLELLAIVQLIADSIRVAKQ